MKNNYEIFIKENYKKAIDLSNKFKKTRLLDWTPLDILNELGIQIGHVFNIDFNDYGEIGRNINNLGDELSDVILQAIALANSIKINISNYKKEDLITSSSVDDLVVIFGQLTESVMEINNKRFYKKRENFKNHEEYILACITRIISITLNIASKNNLDMIKEFNEMNIDATNFLKNFNKKTYSQEEYVDIYDSLEKYLGIYKKEKLHNSNYYAKTVNCIYINPVNRTVFLQIKNHKHNDVFKTDLCELTSGGHLLANESVVKGLLRESKEETGLNINKGKLHFYKKRRKSLNLKKDYFIREFQHFFFYVDNIKLKDLKADNYETMSFVEVKIKDLINLLEQKKKKIKAKYIFHNKIFNTNITLDNFNPIFFLEDFVINLFKYSNTLCISKFKRYKEIYNLRNKIKLITKYYEHRRCYFYTINSHSIKIQNIENDILTYYVVLSKEDDKYSVYVKIKYKNKIIASYLFYKEYDKYEKVLKYFYKTINVLKSKTNNDILDLQIKSYKSVKINK